MEKIFKNKKVTIMGLGLRGGGAGAVKFFYKQGADILVTDLKTKSRLKESLQKIKNIPIKFVLGKHREKDFINADLIVKNPAVSPDSPYLKVAKKHNVPVKTDINIFFDLCPARIIGITGTKGKSTTATLCYLFLKSKYSNVVLAGNIGVSPLEIFSRINKNLDIGGGITVQIPRSLENFQGDFYFVPLYGAIRVRFDTENVIPYFIGQFGYNFFDGDSDYKGIIDLDGGLYWGIGGGIITNQHFLIELLYSVNNGTGRAFGISGDVEYSKVTINLGYNF